MQLFLQSQITRAIRDLSAEHRLLETNWAISIKDNGIVTLEVTGLSMRYKNQEDEGELIEKQVSTPLQYARMVQE